MQTGGHAVHVEEAGAHAGDFFGAVVGQFLHAVEQLHDQRIHAVKALLVAAAFLADLKDLGFGLVEDLRHIAALRIEGVGRDLVAGRNQFAQHGALAHDLGVAADIGGAGHALRQRVQVGQPAGVFGLALVLQMFEHGDHVRRLAGVDQRGDRRIDQFVFIAVEVAVDQQIAGAVPGAVVEQQASQHALLAFDGVRRHPQAGDVVGTRTGIARRRN
ncbi:hypothetical protein GALL_546940 [mine drainage metagenome]|uniref:Uncharacterized protein n=1 Tax=mine drainage metagenome TaxID=410659 RepID=A0A1J5P8H9_9ZZZZ